MPGSGLMQLVVQAVIVWAALSVPVALIVGSLLRYRSVAYPPLASR